MHMHVWANTSIHRYLLVCAFVYVHGQTTMVLWCHAPTNYVFTQVIGAVSQMFTCFWMILLAQKPAARIILLSIFILNLLIYIAYRCKQRLPQTSQVLSLIPCKTKQSIYELSALSRTKKNQATV